jgi:hypothetical protein
MLEKAGILSAVVVTLVLLCPIARAQDQAQPEPEQQEKKLGERLIRRAVADADEDIMSKIIRLMGEASRKLEVEFDAGEETQALQQQITDRLDEAIKVAASQLRPKRSIQKPGEGDKRKMPRERKKPADRGDGSQGEATEDASSLTAQDAPSTAGAANGDGEKDAARRAWGHLPPRQRDEVIQGIGEIFLERYRAWIERYYRALQETEE